MFILKICTHIFFNKQVNKIPMKRILKIYNNREIQWNIIFKAIIHPRLFLVVIFGLLLLILIFIFWKIFFLDFLTVSCRYSYFYLFMFGCYFFVVIFRYYLIFLIVIFRYLFILLNFGYFLVLVISV